VEAGGRLVHFPEIERLAAELTEIFSARELHRTAGELIRRLSTFPRRKIRPGTGPDFLERAKIFFDGSNLSGAAQNFFRPPESSWIRPKLLRPARKFLDPIQKIQDGA
jgi:hypothetical protein